jgi:hypothetical protein
VDGAVVEPEGDERPTVAGVVSVRLDERHGHFAQQFGFGDGFDRRIVVETHPLEAGAVHVAAEDAVPDGVVAGRAGIDCLVHIDQGVARPGGDDGALVVRFLVNADRVGGHAHQFDVVERGGFWQEGAEGRSGKRQAAQFEKIAPGNGFHRPEFYQRNTKASGMGRRLGKTGFLWQDQLQIMFLEEFFERHRMRTNLSILEEIAIALPMTIGQFHHVGIVFALHPYPQCFEVEALRLLGVTLGFLNFADHS